ncbi:putative fluoride ion transporter CrcB [Desulfosarcina widdelii]|uniref:Fluoride-specific ion channel FluC n=1 Tax=Desulfosarcina widdelii TaxID=947919 RepID=A0A5K7ZJE6_9BACT|nr:CrcB family protein [Desulfosarcina widdelii]BBO76197.1 putative fluoride ion transporter CrcB [Desulfosarcina widdelii]
MMQKLSWLALAGAKGTLARYGLTGLVHKINGMSFPWGTVVVNIAGCLLAGLFWSLFENRWAVSSETRTIVIAGFMGAFTTFSAMVLETSELFRLTEWLHAVANLTIQNGLGLFALYIGLTVGRLS